MQKSLNVMAYKRVGKRLTFVTAVYSVYCLCEILSVSQ